jgi:hypothetical protein
MREYFKVFGQKSTPSTFKEFSFAPVMLGDLSTTRKVHRLLITFSQATHPRKKQRSSI